MTPRIATGLRVVSALQLGAYFVARPRGVVHLYSGPCTRSGRAVPRARRPLCGARTNRLAVVARPDGPVDLGERRFCRRCTSNLPPSLGLDVRRLVSRDDWIAAYRHLTIADLTQAARWAETVDDTHQVAHLATKLHGPALPHLKHPTPEQAARLELEVVIEDARRTRQRQHRTTEEAALLQQQRDLADAASDNARLLARQRKHEDQVARLVAKSRRNGYLLPWERDLIKTA